MESCPIAKVSENVSIIMFLVILGSIIKNGWAEIDCFVNFKNFICYENDKNAAPELNIKIKHSWCDNVEGRVR